MFNYTEYDDSRLAFYEVTESSNLPVGERLFIEINGKPIVLLNIEGRLFAAGDVCTHDNGPLGDGEVENHGIICPRHGARFDLCTGKVLGLPATTDIPVYPVRVRNEIIEVGIPV
jgi:3-phenylpropionate/trans-cinnamate dioxygenase ferredoxin component